MAAGVGQYLWVFTQIAGLLDGGSVSCLRTIY